MRKGFTLIEIMIAVAIIATLAVVAIPNLKAYYLTVQERTCIATISRIDRAGHSYWARYGQPPKTIDDLVTPAAPFLKEYPKCSFGGSYLIQENSEWGFVVTCSAHDEERHNVNPEKAKKK